MSVDNLKLGNISTYQAGVVQAALHRSLQKICDDALRPFGISKMQWMIIGTVSDAGPAGVRLSDLAETVGTTIPYLTTTVNLLESKGYLVRNDNTKDSRSKLVAVSPTIHHQIEEIEAAVRDGLRKSIYADIDPAEFQIYMKVMYRLSELGKQITTPKPTAHKD